MTKTEYQQHLLDEYASYLRKSTASNPEKVYTMTAQELAAALLKAFEKGATKGILYESLNDIQKVEQFAKKESEKPQQKPSQSDFQKKIGSEEALDFVKWLFEQAMQQK